MWAPIGASQPGVVIPAAAAVISDGKYWCYVEKKPGTFVRAEIDTSRPSTDGYFVTQGVGGRQDRHARPAQLLARESNSGAEAD